MPERRLAERHVPALWVDALVVLILCAIIAGVVGLARRWVAPLQPAFDIDLSPWALPRYALYSLERGFAAYALSLVFTLIYGTVAAYNPRAERIMIPLLDILQGIPVLGFLPGLVLGMVALFPRSTVGLELACVVMIFTGQVWNMTFSFYGSLRAIPADLREVAQVHRFGWWTRFRTLEVPAATIGLVWNSMMSMAGGWFFLTVTEAFTLGNHDFRLPGIGSYMSVAIDRGDVTAMLSAIVAMVIMIVAVDQLVWRPIIVWAEKFKIEESGAATVSQSWVLDLLRRSRMTAWLRDMIRPRTKTRLRTRGAAGPRTPAGAGGTARGAAAAVVLPPGAMLAVATWSITVVFAGLTMWGVIHLAGLLCQVTARQWLTIVHSLVLTFLRTSAAVCIGAAWAVPAGIRIGLSPRLSRIFQPVIQVVAAFPAPMLFPLVTAAFLALGVRFSWGCVALMLLGAQWYLLFNVLAGAMAIPQDLRETVDVYRLRGFAAWRTLYLPSVFPQLVTGLITAAGGAWNASIVSEYLRYKDRTLVAPGLGALITQATAQADFPLLAASVLIMALTLAGLNRMVWKRLYHLADTRYSLNR
ncbi:MAG: transporter, inner rane subunit [Deltaproteobacteria bacterium]|nr:transporter, inner rane subunit [Deltaproteobacteria bacterium]